MAVLLVSFTTRPGQGSEGGVGWQFLLAWSRFGARTQTPIHAVIDRRDEADVREALRKENLSDYVELFAVGAPSCMPKKVYGSSRTRMSYMAWRIKAQRKVRELSSAIVYDLFHQCTFATGSLPPILVKDCFYSIWGPITIPESSVQNRQRDTSTLEPLRNAAGRAIARYFGRRFRMVLAQNQHTANFFSRTAIDVVIEPNIFCPPAQEVLRDTEQVVFVGRLIDRKRPWIPIECLAQPPLRNKRLLFLGDGPLRRELEALADELGVADRVKFLGQRSRPDALSTLSTAGALLLPSSREGAPWVVGEANASGVPAVVAELSGAQTLLQLAGADYGCSVAEQEDGRAFVEEYARSVASVLENSPNPLRSSCRWDPHRFDDMLTWLVYGGGGPTALPRT